MIDAKRFQDIRREYIQKPLNEEDVAPEPFQQFEHWFNEAMEQVLDLANAMTLATISENGEPEARVVLLKGFDKQGFTFFSNYSSAKGLGLAKHPKASLLFYWSLFDRQVRIKGDVVRVSREESEHYFHSRPFESQVAACISAQSALVENRKILEQDFAKTKQRLDSVGEAPLPDHWGGYRLIPKYFEFWQGRENRLHDRLVYSLENNQWTLKRIAP